MNTVAPCKPQAAYSGGWRLIFIRSVLFKKFQQAILALTLLTVAIVSGYVTYRHWTAAKKLPTFRWRPVSLSVPLTEAVITGEPIRWVEIEATAAPKTAGKETLYRNSVESPDALILHFKSDPGNPGRQKYRGVLQAYRTRRANYRYPPEIGEALSESGIVAKRKFAILFIDDSPWPYYIPRITELLVVAGSLCLVSFLLFHGFRLLIALFRPISRRQWIELASDDVGPLWPNRCAHCGHTLEHALATTNPTTDWNPPVCSECRRRADWWIGKLQTLAATTAALAVAWMLYRSLRYRPVIPLGSLLTLGFSSVLGFIVTLYRWRGRRWYPLFVSRKHGSKRRIKSLSVHKAFLLAVAERSHS